MSGFKGLGAFCFQVTRYSHLNHARKIFYFLLLTWLLFCYTILSKENPHHEFRLFEGDIYIVLGLTAWPNICKQVNVVICWTWKPVPKQSHAVFHLHRRFSGLHPNFHCWISEYFVFKLTVAVRSEKYLCSPISDLITKWCDYIFPVVSSNDLNIFYLKKKVMGYARSGRETHLRAENILYNWILRTRWSNGPNFGPLDLEASCFWDQIFLQTQ